MGLPALFEEISSLGQMIRSSEAVSRDLKRSLMLEARIPLERMREFETRRAVMPRRVANRSAEPAAAAVAGGAGGSRDLPRLLHGPAHPLTGRAIFSPP